MGNKGCLLTSMFAPFENATEEEAWMKYIVLDVVCEKSEQQSW